MLIVLANWMFVAVLCGAWGFACHRLLQRWMGSDAPEPGLATIVLSGLAGLTVLCNVVSLWLPIGRAVCLFFSAGAVLLIGLNRSAWKTKLQHAGKSFSGQHRVSWLCFFLLVAIALIKTIGPSEIEDEAAYHLPLIRWIENYPVVPGIANIEDRMGFNPAIYMANALFGLAWLYPGGIYDLNSFLFVLIGGSFLNGAGQLLNRQPNRILSGMVQAGALVFLFRVYLTGVDADFLNIYGTLYLLVCIIGQMEDGIFGKPNWQTLWCLLFFCFLTTNKFSVAVMTPVAGWMLYELVRQRHWQIAGWIILLGSVIIVPWIVRNYYVSGYAVYPLYFPDLFSPDWKTPLGLAKGQYHYVSEFAKTGMVRPFNTYVMQEPALKDWLPVWFRLTWSQLAGKVALTGLLFTSGLWIHSFFVKKRPSGSAFNLLAGFLFLAILAWFWRIPALRFGWPWLLVFLCISGYVHLEDWLKSHWRTLATGLHVLLLLSLGRSAITSVQEGFDWRNRWLRPASVAVHTHYMPMEINGLPVFVAPDNFCGGTLPPCLPKHYYPGLQARGETVQEGFRAVDGGR